MSNRRLKNVPLVLVTLICLGVICAPATLFAAGVDLSLGAGAALVPDYEGSDDSEGYPALLLSAQWEQGFYVKLAGPAIRANALPSKTWSLGPVLQFRKARDNDVENAQVALMREIESTVEAGAFAGFNHAGWDASVQFVGDTSDEHDGSLTKVIAGYSFKEAGVNTRIGISTTYADDDYMDTYFSVDANNAIRSGLPVYKAEADFKDFGVDLTVRYPINDKWDVMGLLGYTAILGDAKDSPIVDQVGNESQVTFGLLAVYNF